MRKVKISSILILTGLLVASISLEGVQSEDRRPPKEKWIQVTLKASVEALDLEKRLVTLKDPDGNLATVEVDKRVERLNEFEVGDVVSAEYWTYLKAEFRDPTPEEKEEPLVVLAEAGKAPEGMDPAAVVGAVVRGVVTVEIINRPIMQVTVKGPRGRYLTFPIADQTLIGQLKVGEVVVLTYAEALAISLEKAAK